MLGNIFLSGIKIVYNKILTNRKNAIKYIKHIDK